MRKPKIQKLSSSLTVLFTLIVFSVLMLTMLCVTVVMTILVKTDTIHLSEIGEQNRVVFSILVFAIVSVVVGTIIAYFVSYFSSRPIRKLAKSLDRLAAGDYSTRLRFKDSTFMGDISDSFNHLAEELDSTEMLRSDFVNNFSHEFKTPIMSIYGFARLINKGATTDEQTKEYLEIIEEESARLSSMATNVLSMTKIENQTILSDLTVFNLSEQIRMSVLLLEKKWVAKNLEMNVEFDEYYVKGNEELLKQVWINLIDNAVKYSKKDGTITIEITPIDDKIQVLIHNSDSYIKPEDRKRIFNKFYQADTSHSSEGTGIGLAVVKKIVKLHNGEVSVDSNENGTTFFVTIPVQK